MSTYPHFHDGRRALVTGAASGIGRAAAIKLAEAGAHVLAVDLNAEGLNALAAEVPGIEPVPFDLSNLDAIGTLPTDVDIVVNNAGIQTVSPIQDFPVERFELIMKVMLHAPWYLIRQSVPHMYAQGWGRIVNLSSAHGLRASEFKSAYVTAKHGLEGLSKVVALEGGPHGVTSVTVNPAYVRTPLVEKQIADQAHARGIPADAVVAQVMLKPMPKGVFIEYDELAGLAGYLLGHAARNITGQAIAIDGGWTAQ